MTSLSKEELIERKKNLGYPGTNVKQWRMLKFLIFWTALWNISALWQANFFVWLGVSVIGGIGTYPIAMLTCLALDYFTFHRHAKGKENGFLD